MQVYRLGAERGVRIQLCEIVSDFTSIRVAGRLTPKILFNVLRKYFITKSARSSKEIENHCLNEAMHYIQG
jgi:hypothetical protein